MAAKKSAAKSETQRARNPRAPKQRKRDKRAPHAPTKPERVREIKRRMASGEWRSGISDHEYADECGLSLSAIHADSAEASRALRDAIENSDLGERLVAVLLNNIHEARKARRFEAVARSAEIAARIAGVDAPKKVDVGGSLADILALGLAASGEESDRSLEE